MPKFTRIKWQDQHENANSTGAQVIAETKRGVSEIATSFIQIYYSGSKYKAFRLAVVLQLLPPLALSKANQMIRSSVKIDTWIYPVVATIRRTAVYHRARNSHRSILTHGSMNFRMKPTNVFVSHLWVFVLQNVYLFSSRISFASCVDGIAHIDEPHRRTTNSLLCAPEKCFSSIYFMVYIISACLSLASSY